MEFENRANFNGQWNIGTGMADLLITELLDSGKVTVLERQHLRDVTDEIMRQGQGLFRSEGRAERGRLKNAKFLIRGVVTDFTVTSGGSGWFGLKKLRIFGGGSRARVAINIRVSDVETGEVVASVKAEDTVGAGNLGAGYGDKRMAFGGDAFFRTPIGKATEAAIRKAVRSILRQLPTRCWVPRVAEGGLDTAVVNGGSNVGLQAGDRFLVRDDGRDITDPVTGNVLEHVPGRVVGRLEVRVVNENVSHAIILEGTARRGQILERVPRP
jgi:curli biogenesis system outer membrane secretion channel CsgG